MKVELKVELRNCPENYIIDANFNHSMIKQVLKQVLRQLTGHPFIAITDRGNSAIEAAVKGMKVLIPEEGGWLSYQKILGVVEVKCVDAKIDLNDLKEKLSANKLNAF